jgi:hypothetical protein
MFIRQARRFFWPTRTGPLVPPNSRAIASRYVAGAELRLREAGNLLSATRPVLAASLARDAVLLLLRAAFFARDVRSVQAGAGSVRSLAELSAATGRTERPDVALVEAALGATDPFFFDSLDDLTLANTYDALAGEAAWLRTCVDLRSPEYLTATRWGRIAAPLVVAGYAVCVHVAAAWPTRDLALHKSVRLSTQQPGTPDPSGLVDGKKGGTYGAHTLVGSDTPAWAIIDLGREVPIRRIVVYNRGDGNFDDGLPYSIDVSTDGNAFRMIATREEPFGLGGILSPPWTAKVHERARYVRIRARDYIALSEVEVF